MSLEYTIAGIISLQSSSSVPSTIRREIENLEHSAKNHYPINKVPENVIDKIAFIKSFSSGYIETLTKELSKLSEIVRVNAKEEWERKHGDKTCTPS